MKKLFFLLNFQILFSYLILAQSPCAPCLPGPVQTKEIEICHFHKDFNCIDGSGNPYTETVDGPGVFVIITYREVDCNGEISLLIDDEVFVDQRDYLDHLFEPPCVSAGAAIVTCSMGVSTPPTQSEIKDALRIAVDDLVGTLGLTTNVDVFYGGACYSLVKLSFPNGTFFPQAPNDLGKADTLWVNGNSILTQSIPCGDICCHVTYEYRLITAENGETHSEFVPISYSGDEVGCSAINPPPSYLTYANRLTGKIYDPITKTYIDVIGTEIEHSNCELTCPRHLMPPPPMFKRGFSTDKSAINESISLELSAQPTLFNEYIRINCKEEISNIVFYDSRGRKVFAGNLDSKNEINTAHLKPGLYYIQVHLPHNVTKTIKVVKE